MNFKSFDIETIKLKYAHSLTKVASVYESIQDEIAYHTNNTSWILETEQIYVHDTGNDAFMLYGGGNISFVSKELLESNIQLNEEDSIWTKIWNAIKSLLSVGVETVAHIIHNIGGIANGDIASMFLAFGGICELLAIFTVLYPPAHPLNMTLCVLAGLGLFIGGISQCFKAGEKLGSLKDQAGKLNESGSSDDPIEIFSDGTQHIMMGIAGVALSSLGIFGGKGIKQTATKVYQSTVKVGLKKSFSVILKAMAKKQAMQKVANEGIKAILKHESKHFFLHYTAAVIAFFLGKNLTKKGDKGNSWVDLIRGIEGTINKHTKTARDTVDVIEKGIKGTVGGYVDALDSAIDVTFNGVDSLIGLFGGLLSKIVGKIGDLVELVESFGQLFQESTTGAAYETVYGAGKSEAEGIKRRRNKDLLPYSKTLSTGGETYVDKNGFVKMGASSTSVNVTYQGKVYQKVGNVVFDSDKVKKSSNVKGVLIATNLQKGENYGKEYGVIRNKDGSYSFYNPKKKVDERFISFGDSIIYKKPVKEVKSFKKFKNELNEGNKMTRKFKGFNDFKEESELNENFISKGINIAKEGLQEIKALFNGMQMSLWDKVGKFNKKDLIDIIEGITVEVSRHGDLNLLNQLRLTEEKIKAEINSGKIKTSKQIALRWQEEMGIYAFK